MVNDKIDKKGQGLQGLQGKKEGVDVFFYFFSS